MSEFSLQAHSTALVIIDLQYGLIPLPVEPRTFDEVVKRTAQLAEAFRAKGATVIWVRVDLHNFRQLIVDQPMMDPNGPPPPPESVEIVEEAGKKPEELLITKRFWGAFDTTPLEAELHKRGIETIVLCGTPRTSALKPQPARPPPSDSTLWWPKTRPRRAPWKLTEMRLSESSLSSDGCARPLKLKQLCLR